MSTVRVLTPLALGVTLAISLSPSAAVEGGVRLCLLCGDRGASDLVLNTLFYLPLGFLVSLRWRSVVRVGLAAAALSTCVELAQLWIPGRFASTADVLANTVGAAVGGTAALHPRLWLRPTPRASRLLTWSFAMLGGMLVMGSALLSRPVVPDAPVFVGWTPDLGGLEQYGGAVRSATAGGHPLPNATRVSGAARDALVRMETIEIDFIVGPSPGWLAPLLHLPVREAPDVLAIFMRGTDIVVRRRSRSADLRLAVPSVTFGGALDGVGPGDTASLVLDLNGGRYRLTVDSTVVTRPLHSARGWSIWYDALGASDRLRTLLDLAWITLLLGPIGYWATSWWGAASGLVPLGATAMAPLLTPVALPSVGYFFCGALALGLGRLTRRLGTIRRSA